ncbi:MAG TPA: DM13 domain-containing protein [Solirubrobacteraceae bacterium]|nr:DM13 domain-containing protein [Solirubrobacteraceae bacterium]
MVRSRQSWKVHVLRVVAAVVVAVVTLAGVWVAGGLVTNSFTGSAIATGVWFALAGIAVLALAIRYTPVRWAVAGAYLLTALTVSAYLGWSMLNDRVVDEPVVVGTPAGQSPAPGGNVEEVAGTFRDGEHDTEGRAAVVRMPDGRRVVTLTRFSTSAGPDLRVRLVPGGGDDGGAAGAHDLGALKGNRGNQQYDVPPEARVRGASVVIWCRAFSATFGTADLAAA